MISWGKMLLMGMAAGTILLLGFTGSTPANAAPSGADRPPVIYEQSRAIPTKSGWRARITLYTKNLNFVKVRVNQEATVRPTRFGRGCGKLRCQKWKLYTERTTDSECYELKIYGRNREGNVLNRMTVCEPFPSGQV